MKKAADPISTEYDPKYGYRRKSVLHLSKGWVQGVIFVLLFGFFVMGFLAFKTYKDSMPLPDKVVNTEGKVLFTKDNIVHGQELFQAKGLQQYGSIVGHGAYLGPDYTAEYLRLAAESVRKQYDNHPQALPKNEQGKPIDATTAVKNEFRANLFDADTKVLTYTDRQEKAFNEITDYYYTYFSEPTTKHGLPANFITNKADVKDLTSFFSWTAWAAAAHRPGLDYSYTNNWPSEPRVGNSPTADVVIWSVLSLIALIGGTGLIFAIYGRWSKQIGWKSTDISQLRFKQPGKIGLTGSQKAVAWFIAVISLLFLGQALLGAATEHYRADLTSFFGIDLAKILPYNLARTWHLQLSLLWTAAAFLAAGIFLTPFISRKEPKHQSTLTYILFGAVVFVVVGSLITEALSIFGKVKEGTLFSQQWEFLDLPRIFQTLLTLGMFIWIIIVFRGLRSRLRTESKANLPWLFFFSGLSIPAFYAIGLLAKKDTHLSVADFWRFWVVHLWVEDFLELFTTIMVAYIFVLLGVVREKVALGIIFLDVILYSSGGVIGTMHHLYFSGTPVEHMALGAFFSAAEVIPLTLLTVEAWTFMQLGAGKQGKNNDAPFPHRWAVMFFIAVGFWNFLGAGIFGFLVNLPIVSYYQIGTALTANHAHAAMMGVYGMLAVGLCIFALRYLLPKDKWSDKAASVSFWLLNIGLLWMCFISLLPLGITQLYKSVGTGYYESRSLGYLTKPNNTLMEWIRMPGDILFLLGILPFVWLAVQGLLNYRSTKQVDSFPENPLFEDNGKGKETELLTINEGD